MGGNCSIEKTDTTNVCTDGVGKWKYEFLAANNDEIVDACTNMGNGEWIYADAIDDNIHDKCYDDRTDEKANIGDGNNCTSCPTSDPASYQTATCERIKFNGDPKICCMKDLRAQNNDTLYIPYPQPGVIRNEDKQLNPSYCYSDSEKKNTCDPKYRDITTNECYEALLRETCSSGNLSSILDNWKDSMIEYDQNSGLIRGICKYALSRYVLGDNWTAGSGTLEKGVPIPTSLSSSGNYDKAREFMGDFLTNYLGKYSLFSLLGMRGYHSLSKDIINICRSSPGLCEDNLRSICYNFTSDEVSKDPMKQMVCGCYLRDEEYDKYFTDFKASSISCSPLCNNINSIPLSSGANTQLCNSSSCVMDNITINLSDSQAGDIDFSQICRSCSTYDRDSLKKVGTSGLRKSNNNANTNIEMLSDDRNNASCQCIIHDINLSSMESKLKNISLKENCSSITCRRPDTNGIIREVPCDLPNNSTVEPDKSEIDEKVLSLIKEKTIFNNLIPMIFLLVIIVMILVFIYISLKNIRN